MNRYRGVADPGDELPIPPMATRVWRGVRMRCPMCGGPGLLKSWFKLRPRCPTCGLHTDRGEHDFYLGAMMFNLVIAEGILLVLLLGLMIATWPDVPWRFLEIGGIALMAAAPFLLFPVSRTIWMAFDLMLHRPTREEMYARPGGGE